MGYRMHDIFISYSRKNSRFISRVVADLEDHGITYWLDTIELNVGDSTHRSIEKGIESSRFFCLAISNHSMRSYYVRKIEFEQAFTRMIANKRDSYILPIIIQKTSEPLPNRIEHIFRLDFTNRRVYSKNMRELVRKIRGTSGGYSGQRWFKGLNISNLGEPVGVGPTTQKASIGHSYCMHWVNGVVTRVDVFTNGKLANYKEFGFDKLGRVIENKMYSPDGAGGWGVIEDVWYYRYDPRTGLRSEKIIKFLGENTSRVVSYDEQGYAIDERIETEPGMNPDRQFPYVRKVFEYDTDGNAMGEQWFDSNGDRIEPI